jgi:hypothetical protein
MLDEAMSRANRLFIDRMSDFALHLGERAFGLHDDVIAPSALRIASAATGTSPVSAPHTGEADLTG